MRSNLYKKLFKDNIMPYGKNRNGRKKKVYKKNNRRYKKNNNGLNSKEKKEVMRLAKQIAKSTVSQQTTLKKQITTLPNGAWNHDALSWNYGRPKFNETIEDVVHFSGLQIDDKTKSIPLGLIQHDAGETTWARRTNEILKTSASIIFIFTYNPALLDCPVTLTYGIFSTENDPLPQSEEGQVQIFTEYDVLGHYNQTAIYNETQDPTRLNHIASNLMPIPTFNYVSNKRDMDQVPALDMSEYKKHWVKTIKFYPDPDGPQEKQVVKKFFFKIDKREKYGSIYDTSLMGKRYYLLINSTNKRDETSSANGQGIFMHMNNATYFRDIPE